MCRGNVNRKVEAHFLIIGIFSITKNKNCHLLLLCTIVGYVPKYNGGSTHARAVWGSQIGPRFHRIAPSETQQQHSSTATQQQQSPIDLRFRALHVCTRLVVNIRWISNICGRSKSPLYLRSHVLVLYQAKNTLFGTNLLHRAPQETAIDCHRFPTQCTIRAPFTNTRGMRVKRAPTHALSTSTCCGTVAQRASQDGRK